MAFPLSRTFRQKLWPSILWGARNTQDRRHTQDTMCGFCVATNCVWLSRVGPSGGVQLQGGAGGASCRTVCGGCGAGRVSWAETGAWGGVDKYSSGHRGRALMVMRPHVDVPTRYALSTRHTPLLQVCSPHISTLVTTHTSACLADVLMALCTIHLLLWRGPRDPAPFPHGAASHTRAGSVAHWALDLRWRLAALAGFAGGSRSFAARPSATASSASGSSATLAAYSRMKACRCSSASARSARA